MVGPSRRRAVGAAAAAPAGLLLFLAVAAVACASLAAAAPQAGYEKVLQEMFNTEPLPKKEAAVSAAAGQGGTTAAAVSANKHGAAGTHHHHNRHHHQHHESKVATAAGVRPLDKNDDASEAEQQQEDNDDREEAAGSGSEAPSGRRREHRQHGHARQHSSSGSSRHGSMRSEIRKQAREARTQARKDEQVARKDLQQQEREERAEETQSKGGSSKASSGGEERKGPLTVNWGAVKDLPVFQRLLNNPLANLFKRGGSDSKAKVTVSGGAAKPAAAAGANAGRGSSSGKAQHGRHAATKAANARKPGKDGSATATQKAAAGSDKGAGSGPLARLARVAHLPPVAVSVKSMLSRKQHKGHNGKLIGEDAASLEFWRLQTQRKEEGGDNGKEEGDSNTEAKEGKHGGSGSKGGSAGARKHSSKAQHDSKGQGKVRAYNAADEADHPPQPETWSVYQRLDIAELDAMADTNPYKILTLMAWAEMTACKDLNDPLGYWALAGVHGLGWNYDGQEPSDKGFCLHAEPSFAAWHRPYVWTFEQGLRAAAGRVVSRINDPEIRATYEEVLPTLRLAYWDFTSPEVPGLLYAKEVTVIDEDGNFRTIRNPLHSLKYPKSPGADLAGYTTRGPRWLLGVRRGSGPWKKELVAALRSRNHGCTYNSEAKCPGNLEQVHNSVHTTLGSDAGELAKAEYAAFDPLFWLLHAAVDRCVWLFQNNAKDSEGWVEAETYVPFKPPVASQQHIGALGYTYREPWSSSSSSSSSGSRRRLLTRSQPNALPHEVPAHDAGTVAGSAAGRAAVQRALTDWSEGYFGYHWQLQFGNFSRYQVAGTPANVFVLLKAPRGSGASQPLPLLVPDATDGKDSTKNKDQKQQRYDVDELRTRPDFCGSIEGFSDDEGVGRMSKVRVNAAVDLTDCLQRAGLDTAVAPKDAEHAERGPGRAAVKLSQLRVFALAADGTDLTAQFKFGKPVVSWTLPVDIRVRAADEAMLLSRGVDRPAAAGGSGLSSSSSSGSELVFAQLGGEL